MKLIENLVYQKETGIRGLYDFYLPQDEGVPCNTLFFYIHGGGLEGGSKEDIRPTLQTLAKDGIACASINYCLFGDGAVFPQFIEDCALALHTVMTDGKKRCPYQKLYVGGSSAGAYLSMMLFCNPAYLAAYNISPYDIDGWFFDAGQPTSHFGILQRSGHHPLAVRIDETAPMFYVDKPFEKNTVLPRLHFVWADRDMLCRPEQNQLMISLLKGFGYPNEKITCECVENSAHCQYNFDAPHFAGMIKAFLQDTVPNNP